MFCMWSRSWDWRKSWVSNVFYVAYELRLKKQLSISCLLCEDKLRLNTQLSVECFVYRVGAEIEERVECRMFSMWRKSWGWRKSWVSNVFYVEYELKLKKQLSISCLLCEDDLRLNTQLSVECFVCGVRAEAKERVECRIFTMWRTSWGWRKIWMSNVFYVDYEMRLKKELSVKCFLCGVRAEAEETVECQMFSMWSTSWGWRNSWVCPVFCVKNELKLNTQVECRMFCMWSKSWGWRNCWPRTRNTRRYDYIAVVQLTKLTTGLLWEIKIRCFGVPRQYFVAHRMTWTWLVRLWHVWYWSLECLTLKTLN